MGYLRGQERVPVDQQFLAGGSCRNWITLLREYGGVDRRYLLRGISVSALALLGAPFRLYERYRFNAQIEDTQIADPPIFIIGHWRTGTTYIHQLLGQDPDLAIVTMLHTMGPELYLSCPILRPILRSSLPTTRPMDNVYLSPAAAEEEEYALGNLGPYSFYHALCFPRRMRDIFDRYVVFEGVSDDVVRGWQAAYTRFLKKVTFSSGGRRLLLKNPANTGRVRMLLELFPGAKFVHVYRNPYVVYASTMHWLDKEMEITAFQRVSADEVEEHALINYEKLMRRYFADGPSIPDGDLVEVRFEDFEAAPMAEVERIYEQLELELGPIARSSIQQRLASLVGYQKNAHQLERSAIGKVARRWGFAVERWGYAPPNIGES